jgi:hypothetical protein
MDFNHTTIDIINGAGGRAGGSTSAPAVALLPSHDPLSIASR